MKKKKKFILLYKKNKKKKKYNFIILIFKINHFIILKYTNTLDPFFFSLIYIFFLNEFYCKKLFSFKKKKKNLSILFFLYSQNLFIRLETYLETNCRINTQDLESQLRCSKRSCTRVYRTVMSVRYNNTILNQEIQTIAYNSFKGEFGASKKVSKFILVHPVGSLNSKCYFDPNEATTAVFNFEQNSGAIVGEVFGGIFMFIGLIFVVVGVFVLIK